MITTTQPVPTRLGPAQPDSGRQGSTRFESVRGTPNPLLLALLGLQVGLLGLDFGKVGLTSAGGIDLGRWLVILPGQVLIGAIVLALSPQLWRRLRTAPALLLGAWLIWNLIGVVWSVDPRQTLLQSFGALNLWLGGLWLVSRYGAFTFFRLTSRSLAAVVALGIGYQYVIGIDRDTGRLEGLSEGFNQFGVQCAYGLLVTIAARTAQKASTGTTSRADIWIMALFSVALFGSGGRGALAATVVALVLYFVLTSGRKLLRARVAAPVFVVVAGVAFALSQGVATFSRGNDNALNGREIIWSHAWSLIQGAPLRGHGMMAGLSLWTEAVVQGLVDFTPGSAHNMYLEVLVGGGTIGMALFASAIGATIFGLIRGRQWAAISLLVITLTTGLVESLIARPALTHWVLGGMVALAAIRPRNGARSASPDLEAQQPILEPESARLA